MSTPTLIPTSWLSTVPTSETISNVRPGADGKWVMFEDTEPEMIVQLVETGAEAIPVGKVEMDGNVSKFSIYFKTTVDADVRFVPVSNNDDDVPQVLWQNS